MRKIEITSPAKLNLYLRVIKKRKDGFHEIVTIFERINLLDYVLIEKAKRDIKLVSDNKDLVLDKSNLVYKAALLFSKNLNKALGVKIKIFKNIPIGAGLGGGSSNAASILLGINQLYELGLDRSLLFKWAAEIGSDISFFLTEKNFALGRGRGDKIFPLDLDIRLWHVLIYPNIAIYTKDVYNSFDTISEKAFFNTNYHESKAKLPRIVEGIHSCKFDKNSWEFVPEGFSQRFQERGLTKRQVDVKILLKALEDKRLDLMKKGLFNSLEEVVESKYRAISFWKRKLLLSGAKGVLVSGSGSSIFGILSNRKEAEGVKRKLEKLKRGKIFVVSTY